ncbi:MAG: ABC transporter permease [Clostridia bacterium]|nr:ABC transporter permease [Clostridia bacterium]
MESKHTHEYKSGRKTLAFAKRNTKEMVRDPLTVLFGIGFPVIVLLLLTLIQSNIPVPMFELESLTPGMIIFGYSFVSLFAGMLISKDRGTSLMLRLFTSPMKSSNFILGYVLPLLPLAVAQGVCTFIVAYILGLNATVANALLTLAVSLPCALFFISLGLLCGTLLNEKQVGGICGALITNVSAWLSGAWIPLDTIGGTFKAVAYALPFANAVSAGKAALAGDYSSVFPYLWWVLGYAAVMTVISVVVFTTRIKSDNK